MNLFHRICVIVIGLFVINLVVPSRIIPHIETSPLQEKDCK